MTNLDEFDPPDRPDFRRVGKGVPFVIDPSSGKRVRYSRSSNAGKILDDESNLTDWKLRTVVAGAAQRPELMAQASVLDVDSDKKALRDIAEECLVAGKGQRRAIIGNAVHAMFDHIDRNDGWVPPPQYNDLVDAYVATLETWGLIPVGIEVHCINDEFRLAGTLDRRYRTTKPLIAPDGQVIPIGSVIVGDTKTGKELEYASGSYCTQLAAYVDSVQYDVATDERSPFDQECVTDWALILHADSAGARVDVYWVDINAGREGLKLARQVKAWRQRQDLLTLGQRFRVVDPPSTSSGERDADDANGTVPVPPVAPANRTDDREAFVPATVPAGVPTLPQDRRREDSRIEYLRGRVRAVLGHSEVAGAALQRRWPTGIAGLKVGGHSMDELDAIESAIVRVETDHSVPWYPAWNDPDIEESKLSHPSNVWSRAEPANDEDRETIRMGLMNHPRRQLLQLWIGEAVSGGIDSSVDTTALANALYEFAKRDVNEWPDHDLTLMLEGALRNLGYQGIKDLGKFNPEDAPLLMSAAFAITAGTAVLILGDDGSPELLTDVKQ